MKYIQEENAILRRYHVKEVYDYVKVAIDIFTISEIDYDIKIMDRRGLDFGRKILGNKKLPT